MNEALNILANIIDSFAASAQNSNANNTQYQPELKETDCNDANCPLIEFIHEMKKYLANSNAMASATCMDNSYLLHMLNMYLHLLHEHDTNETFQFILDEMGTCDLRTCPSFIRNHRNRLLRSHNQLHAPFHQIHLAYAIMDKMHCYFQHSFDVGLRLSTVDRSKLGNAVCNDSESESDAFPSRNPEIATIRRIIACKQAALHTIWPSFDEKPQQKYNRLAPMECGSDMSESKSNDRDGLETYQFGYMFEYGFACEEVTKTDDSIPVLPMYSSFKDELLNNRIAVLSIEQYEHEHKNALIHFQSEYCKKNKAFQPHEHHRRKRGASSSIVKTWSFAAEYVLAIMIYCNYDSLQYLFSETYREAKGANHREFYHLGKFLKVAVHEFGERISKGQVQNFYHGTSQAFHFPQYIRKRLDRFMDVTTPQQIYGPLSTSASFEVALNFGNQNQGFIVTFVQYEEHARYFECGWLSNYASERECLFIQNSVGLNVSNILDLRTNTEYGIILNVTNFIEDITTGKCEDRKTEANCANSFRTCTQKILSNQIAKYLKGYQPFTALDQYASNILKTYFENKKYVTIEPDDFQQYCAFFAEFFLHFEYEWINLKLITCFFPNIQEICVRGINLCSTVFDDIIEYLQSSDAHLRLQITITFAEKSDIRMSLRDIIHQYATQLWKFHACIASGYGITHARRNVLYIDIHNEAKFVTKLVRCMNGLYFEDPEGTITALLDRLVHNQMSQTLTSTDSEASQRFFSAYCNQLTYLAINWDDFMVNEDSYLHKLLYLQHHQWIDLDVLMKLFPNVSDVHFEYFTLSEFVMENILHHLTESTSNWNNILIMFVNECELSTAQAIFKYGDRFKTIDCSIDKNDEEEQEYYPYLCVNRKPTEVQ